MQVLLSIPLRPIRKGGGRESISGSISTSTSPKPSPSTPPLWRRMTCTPLDDRGMGAYTPARYIPTPDPLRHTMAPDPQIPEKVQQNQLMLQSLISRHGFAKGTDNGNSKYPVCLRVYDISEGKAAQWSSLVLRKHMEGVWHTGLLVYGYEYFYGDGVVRMRPQHVEETYAMDLYEVKYLGDTSVPQRVYERFLQCISPAFNSDTYDLVDWNCNDFTNFCTQYLLDGVAIPSYILGQPTEVLKSNVGKFAVFCMRLSHGAVRPEDVFGNKAVAAAHRLLCMQEGAVP
eukprot:GHVO01039537.1.p1 GENE.GHVO01039537.1~~GHVO01039537.1.p1  ORF type:complete len:287 (+),score=49.56 GHVO01039537.1:699-1559(+)